MAAFHLIIYGRFWVITEVRVTEEPIDERLVSALSGWICSCGQPRPLATGIDTACCTPG